MKLGVAVATKTEPGILVGYAAPRQCKHGTGFSLYLSKSWKLPDGRIINGTEEEPLSLTLEAGDNLFAVPMDPTVAREVPEGKVASTHTVIFHPANMTELLASLPPAVK